MEFSANNSSVSAADVAIYSYPELVFTGVGFCLISLVAIVGNSLVLIAVARTKRLQNITNVFVVNLSISDSLSSFAILWSVPGMVSRTPGYPLRSEVPCVASAVLVFTTVACGLYTLANIALNRCMLITRSRESYQWLYTPRKTALMVAISWLVPFCGTVIPPLMGKGGVGFDSESRTCTDTDTHPEAATYDKVQFGVFYPLPLIVIVVSYILVWRHVRQHFRHRQATRGTLQSSTAIPSGLSSACKLDDNGGNDACSRTLSAKRGISGRRLGRKRNDQLAITKNLFVVVFAFIACFTPLAFMVVTKNNRYQLYGGLLLFVSGCINPFIYATKHPHFKPVIRSMVRCRCSRD